LQLFQFLPAPFQQEGLLLSRRYYIYFRSSFASSIFSGSDNCSGNVGSPGSAGVTANIARCRESYIKLNNSILFFFPYVTIISGKVRR